MVCTLVDGGNEVDVATKVRLLGGCGLPTRLNHVPLLRGLKTQGVTVSR